MRSEVLILLSYFLCLIIIGSAFLLFPVSWNGGEKLEFIDALFTSTSAVCVTGLITVDTTLYSRFGQVVILLLIQMGGLGVISFSTLYIVLPSRKLSLKGSKIIKEYFIDSIEFEPKKIIVLIISFTLIIELTGMISLYLGFVQTMKNEAFFYALFHAVSAFCNAGFSLFSNSLENYRANQAICITIMMLIVLGGIGFIVIRDIIKRLTGKKKHLALHTKMVIITTLLLILVGSTIIFLLEYNHILKELSIKDKIINSFFQAITPRTAGFNTVKIRNMSVFSRILFIPLMIIGGSPGSISGGIKVTTFFIILLLLFKKIHTQKGIVIMKRRLPMATINKVTIFIIKALFFLFLSFFLLTICETLSKPDAKISLFALFFECTSAFGTVGLSFGITSGLSLAGKTIIIATMLLGRVGLIIIMMKIFSDDNVNKIIYPKEEVLIGS